MPIVLKDLIDLGGVPRTNGSRRLANIPEKSVAYVDDYERSWAQYSRYDQYAKIRVERPYR